MKVPGHNPNRQGHYNGTDDESIVSLDQSSSIYGIALLLSLGFCIGFYQIVTSHPQCTQIK